MLTITEDDYQWHLLQDQIKMIKDKIDTEQKKHENLKNALCLIPSRSFYVLSSSTNSIFSHKSAHHSDDDIIKFKLIRPENDFNIEFAPKFNRILRKNEKLLGHQKLQINIYCLLPSLDFYLNIDYDEKITCENDQQFQLDDVIDTLKQWFPSITTSLDVFVSKMENENEYSPFGEQLLTYELKEEEVSSYFIYRINQQNLYSNSKFSDWYARLKTFLVFFIDIVPSIDNNDSNWSAYILYEQYQNGKGHICYAPIGFITVYFRYAYPNKKRPQISEMLIFPPYQRKGHGRRLLTMIYDDLKTDSNIQDITPM